MMSSRTLISAYILISLYLPSKASFNKKIYVSPSGNDTQGCGNQNQPCKSLDEAFAMALHGSGGASSTLISAAKGNYTLTETFNFTNVNNFALVGEGSRSDEVKITCEPNVSLSFILCQNISFQGFMLHGCGGWRESSVGLNKSAHAGQTHQGVKFKTALDFRYCRNTRFTNIEISSSPGLGVNFYDVGGVVNFTDCVLADNKAISVNKSFKNDALEGFIEEGYVYSGGGIYMILNQYGDNVVNVTPSEHDSFQHNNTYIFRNCRFLRNEASGGNLSHKHDLVDNPGPSQFSLGGGLAINFRGNASNCTTKIESCVFLGNYAVWGGGLQIETRNEVSNNHFATENTSFQDNTGLLAGGGVRMGNFLERGTSDPLNTFTFDNCSFLRNSAIWGGGLSLYGTSVLCRINCAMRKTQFSFNRSTWSGNSGTVGAALATMLADQNDVQIGPEMPYSISFKDCLFSSNQVVKLDEGVTIGEGALFSDQVRLKFQGAIFINNTNTALSLDGSTVEIFDKVNFSNNTGYRGGAVAMRGLSRIIFQERSELVFYNNLCDHKGGALYIESAGSPLVYFNATGINTHECFFGYSNEKADFKDWNTSVIFQGNSAVDDRKGNSVYATTLRNCRTPGESRQYNNVLKWNFVQFKTLNGTKTSRDSEVTTDAITMTYEPKEWKVAPGETFDATVTLIDEIGHSVVGIVDVDISFDENASPVKLDTTSSLFLTDGRISHLRLAGKPGSLFNVSLRYIGRQILEDTIPDIKMRSCHEGFKPVGSTCVCMDSLDEGVARCDSDGKTVYLKQGYWGGKVHRRFVTYYCPAHYCNFTESVIPGEYQYLSGHVCKDGRDQNSVLCGACKPGYSILFGNENCSNSCTNRWLWMIIAYIIGLFIVTCLVLLVNPNLSSGHLNACLYSYQIMKILTPQGFTFDPVIEVLVALCNLQIQTAHGICFASGLNNADKLVIMAAVPVVEIAVLMLLTILFPLWRRALQRLSDTLQHSHCCPGTCRNAFIRWLNSFWVSFIERGENGFAYAFCTIAVLCYVDVTRISLQLLHPAKVGERTVLFADGSMKFFVTGRHIVYGSIAIALMLVVICVPVIFIFYTGSNRHLEPLRACYKTGRHAFVAFYLGCRVLLLIVSTYVADGPLKSALLQFWCFVFLFIIAVARPYRESARGNEAENQGEAADETAQNRWINESDLVILTTLGAIVVLSSPISSNVSKNIGNGLIVCVKILAYTPLVMVVLPYVPRAFNALRGTRNVQVPEPEDGPSEPDRSSTERSPLLDSVQQQGVFGRACSSDS